MRLVTQALEAGRVLTIKTVGGDTLTACKKQALLWGRSRHALPSGRDIAWGVSDVAAATVAYCNRGAAARAARAALGIGA
jgi:hypothetical protein